MSYQVVGTTRIRIRTTSTSTSTTNIILIIISTFPISIQTAMSCVTLVHRTILWEESCYPPLRPSGVLVPHMLPRARARATLPATVMVAARRPAYPPPYRLVQIQCTVPAPPRFPAGPHHLHRPLPTIMHDAGARARSRRIIIIIRPLRFTMRTTCRRCVGVQSARLGWALLEWDMARTRTRSRCHSMLGLYRPRLAGTRTRTISHWQR